MNRRQDIANQIFFILIIIFIIFLLWGYGAGWLGASADVGTTGKEQAGLIPGVSNGVKKLWHKSYFQDERNWNLAL